MKIIKSVIYLLALTIVLFACQSTSETSLTQEELTIIPQPAKVILSADYFVININTAIFCNGKELFPLAKYLDGKLKSALGFTLKTKPGSGKGINLSIFDSEDKTLGNEGYRLNVTAQNIEIIANKPNGIFYGIQSLMQMMPPQIKSGSVQDKVKWKIQCAEIEDMPRFRWRGLLLDVSRHFFTKDEVKKYIDQLSEYKMNILQLHLTDDQGWRVEIKSLPKLTEKGAWRAGRVGDWWQRDPQENNEPTNYGGFYTHEDIKEIVQYAQERFVEIIPEIEVPGHSMATIVAYPEISCTHTAKEINVGNKFYREEENSLCAGKDLTFEYLEKIFAEVAMLFPSDYIHVGGDECYKGFWEKCAECQKRIQDEKLKDTDELQSYFIKRVEKILQDKNKKLIGWDEIIEGGLAPNATVMSWRGMKGGIKAAKQGHQVIMSPTHNCYLDFYQGEPSVEPVTYRMCRLSDAYRFEPVPDGVDPKYILGGEGTLWTESVPNFRHAQYMTWPRGWALAEVFWSPKESKSWEHFVAKVKAHFVRADFGKVNYARSMYNAIITPFEDDNSIFRIKLETEISGLTIYYTFDNTNPDLYSKKYESPLTIPKNATRLNVITYEGDKSVGKMISLRIDELEKSKK